MNSPALWCSGKFHPATTAIQQEIITKLSTTRAPQCNSAFSFWMRVAKKSNKIPFIRTIPACLQKQQFKYRVLIAWQPSAMFPKTALVTCKLVKMANGVESDQNVVLPVLEDAKQCRFLNATTLGAGISFKEFSLEFKTKPNVAVPNDFVLLFFCNNTQVVRSLPISFSSRREGEDKVCPWNTYFDDDVGKNRRSSNIMTLLQQHPPPQVPSYMASYIPPPVFNAMPATPLPMPMSLPTFSMSSLPPAASSSSTPLAASVPTPQPLPSLSQAPSNSSSYCKPATSSVEAPCLFLFDTEEPLMTPPPSQPVLEGLQYADLQSPVLPSPLSRLLADSDMFTCSTALTPAAAEVPSSVITIEPEATAPTSNKTFVQPQNDVLLLLNDDNVSEENFLLEEELDEHMFLPSVGSKRAREDSPTPIEDERAAKSLRLSPFISEPSNCEILM